MNNNEALKGHLDLLLLAIIQKGPAHGYSIIESLRTRSGGTFTLPEGTIYPALHRLEEEGYLLSEWHEETGRRKRIYQITQLGEQTLTRRRNEWHQFSHAVDATITF